ncbi:amidohydrolase family protein [Haematomicrobium sanguinis]|uniref:amidohydrolase family protein n=1 Tax=Haematomicrobium sanguinis TaxID=479106 RepID=UPI00047AB850|nr:amidohydrolase family protein [Haematomicrobium sanguinis]
MSEKYTGPKIDAHHHVWDLTVREQDWIDPETMAPIARSFSAADFERLAAAAGVSASVLVQTVTVAEETPEFLEIAASSPVISAVTGWVDLTNADAEARLNRLLASPAGNWLKAIRHQVQGEPDPRWLLRDDVQSGMAAVQRAGLSYEFVVLPSQLDAVIESVGRNPDLPHILDHAAKPDIATGDIKDWTKDIHELAVHPNVTCKVSGLVTEADWSSWKVADLRPVFDTLLDAFGPERLMFGSDWPVSLLASDYARIWDTYEELAEPLSLSEQAALFHDTATNTYHL